MAIRSFLEFIPQIAEGVYVDEQASVIGRVSIGRDASIWPMTVVRGDVHEISIGERTNVQDGSILHVTADNEYNPGGHALRIGNDVTIGHGAILHACTVEDLCLIGMGATVLDGAIIRQHCILAAGSVVPPGKELEGGYLWMGSPAKRARELKPKELEYLRFSSGHYLRLKNQYLASGANK